MRLNSFFPVNSLVIFLKYIFECVFNTARSALNVVSSMEEWLNHTYILSSVVVRKRYAQKDVRGLIPDKALFSFFFHSFCHCCFDLFAYLFAFFFFFFFHIFSFA